MNKFLQILHNSSTHTTNKSVYMGFLKYYGEDTKTTTMVSQCLLLSMR